MKKKIGRLKVNDGVEGLPRHLLDTPITKEELKAAVSKGACNKGPRRDSICLEFFQVNRDTIKDDMLALFKNMYLDGRIIALQKHDIVLCILKTDTPIIPADYRPITVLNTDYKILARIISNRLRSTLSDILHPSQ